MNMWNTYSTRVPLHYILLFQIYPFLCSHWPILMMTIVLPVVCALPCWHYLFSKLEIVSNSTVQWPQWHTLIIITHIKSGKISLAWDVHLPMWASLHFIILCVHWLCIISSFFFSLKANWQWEANILSIINHTLL